MAEWSVADRISDAIVAMAREDDWAGTQLLVGLLLALSSLFETMPQENRPQTLQVLMDAVELCVEDVQFNTSGEW